MPYGGGPVQRDMGASLGATEVKKMTILTKSLEELISEGIITLGRGKVISKKDIAATPGNYPIYSSAQMNEGKFGEYGLYMFDEEMITWSIDGGGRFFYRKKHKFSVTNVGGTLRINNTSILDYRYLYYQLCELHARINFDWVLKAHPSVIRRLYTEIKIPKLEEQRRIVAILDKAEEIKRSTVKTKELKKMMIDCIFREMFGEYFADDKHAMEIENVANFIDYRGKTPPRVQAGIPLINAKCVRPGYFLKEKIDFIEKDTYSKLMTRGYPVIGDVLFTTEGATMGYTCRIPEEFDEFSVGQRLITLQTKENYNSIVLEYMLNSIEVQGKINQSATGSAAKGIRSARFAKIRIPCPPIDLQNKFASIVRKTERSNLGNISDYSTNLANSLTQEILT